MRVEGPGEFNFQAFLEPEIQSLSSGGHHCAASKIYWLRYNTIVLSYSGVETYEPCETMYVKLLQLCKLYLYSVKTIIFGVTCEEVKTIHAV